MSSLTISVDYSSSYSSKKPVFSRDIIKVNVDSVTTVSKIKEAVLKHLNLPYDDLYFLELKRQKLEDLETVSSLGISGKTVLILRCKDVDALFERMRKDRRL